MFGITEHAMQESIDQRKTAEDLQKGCNLLNTVISYFRKRPMKPDCPILDGFTLIKMLTLMLIFSETL